LDAPRACAIAHLRSAGFSLQSTRSRTGDVAPAVVVTTAEC